MPDVHMGYSLPIGGVALLDDVISPAYVGYDIGCGMCCVILDDNANELTASMKHNIFNEVYRVVPTGLGGELTAPEVDIKDFASASGNSDLNNKVNAKLKIQLGTLGSGNHFIEIGKNDSGNIAITIHSGSRNIGHSIASFYMKLNDEGLPKGFFYKNSCLGQAYYRDMVYAQEYALLNRKFMMETILSIFGYTLKDYGMINENHNHAEIVADGVLHRKGATPALKEQLGVIPGNMRDGVYITKGLGNKEYLCSASHGAGRVMSRKRAKSEISLADFTNSMKGIIAKVQNSTLDEAPFAYKNLDTVIEYQEGVVIKVVDKITPLINIKG